MQSRLGIICTVRCRCSVMCSGHKITMQPISSSNTMLWLSLHNMCLQTLHAPDTTSISMCCLDDVLLLVLHDKTESTFKPLCPHLHH